MAQKYKQLHFVTLQSLVNWSVAHLINRDLGFTKKFPFARIGDVITRSTLLIHVEDDVLYKQVTVKTNGGGAVLRNKNLEFGKNIGTKTQYLAREGQFIMSKIDARNGAFGIITNELDGAIVTSDFPLFDVNTKLVHPFYLYLLSTTKPFIQYAQSCSRGTTNRQRIDVDSFLSQKIPLPSLAEQNKIVAAYDATIAQAKQYSTQAKDIDEQIEKYLQDELGIPSLQDECKNAVFRDTPYKFICLHRLNDMSDRWDLYNTPHSIFDVLRKSQYPIKQIGDVFHFVTRGWKKVGEEFNYIEIGDVIPILGITGKQKLKVKKAPSRATQVVKTGDLIIGTTRPYLKRFAIVNEDYNNDICSSGFQVVESKNDYNIKYLLEFLLTSYAVEQFEYYMTGALYPAITSKDLRKLQIPLPPLNIQDEIVEHIDVLRKEQKNLQQKSLTLRQQATQQFEQIIFN